MSDDVALAEALRRHWRFSGKDEDIAHEIYQQLANRLRVRS